MSAISNLLKCVQFAAIKHKYQRRLDSIKTPYINHPINVATILAIEAKIDDEEVLLAALLHDTVEDTETTFEEIDEQFGCDVSNIVKEVTDNKILEKGERKRLQIANASKKSYKAKLIILADKLDNLRDLQKDLPTGWSEKRQKEYFVWAKAVVDNIRGTNAILEKKLDDIFVRNSVC